MESKGKKFDTQHNIHTEHTQMPNLENMNILCL